MHRETAFALYHSAGLKLFGGKLKFFGVAFYYFQLQSRVKTVFAILLIFTRFSNFLGERGEKSLVEEVSLSFFYTCPRIY